MTVYPAHVSILMLMKDHVLLTQLLMSRPDFADSPHASATSFPANIPVSEIPLQLDSARVPYVAVPFRINKRMAKLTPLENILVSIV